MEKEYIGTATNLKGECVSFINTDNEETMKGFITEEENLLVKVVIKENEKIIYTSNNPSLLNIIEKIENEASLKEEEIELINDSHVCSVYDFTYSIGHLTLLGKNNMVKNYKHEILKELKTHL